MTRTATTQVAEPTAVSAATAAPFVQRTCTCGASAIVSGKCEACGTDEQLGVERPPAPDLVQTKLTLGTPGDAYEQEADRIADRIVFSDHASGPFINAVHSVTPGPQRQEENEEEEEEEEEIQAKADGAPHNAGVSQAAAAVASGGQPLGHAERAYFEPRLGRNLGAVRLHTGPAAAAAARAINARAYTLRNNIAFASGAYVPATPQGRRLLAHELVHTVQQGAVRTIRRTCPSDPSQIPAGGEKEFETAVDGIKAHKVYTGLKPDPHGREHPRDIADHIIDGARGSACPMFYITKLKVLFDTPRNPKKKTASKMRQRAIDAMSDEQTRLSEWGSDFVGVEEAVTKANQAHMRRQRGEQGKDFWIDDRNPAQIRIKMNVFPHPRGTGTKEDVKRTIALEDAIETRALQNGYLLDIDFVDKSGSDVFEVGVNPAKWVTSGNWVGDDKGLAHEAHHLLNLEDRYNYLSHARNKNMDIPVRLFWFREQMVRPADPLATRSVMGPKGKGGKRTDKLNEEDICAIVRGDYRDCLVVRFGMQSTKQIEAKANKLSHPYRPQHAALLRVMSDAWDIRPIAERTADCKKGDPLCGLAPESTFGDPSITGTDQIKFPLRNPHKQRKGTSLKRKARAKP